MNRPRGGIGYRQCQCSLNGGAARQNIYRCHGFDRDTHPEQPKEIVNVQLVDADLIGSAEAETNRVPETPVRQCCQGQAQGALRASYRVGLRERHVRLHEGEYQQGAVPYAQLIGVRLVLLGRNRCGAHHCRDCVPRLQCVEQQRHRQKEKKPEEYVGDLGQQCLGEYQSRAQKDQVPVEPACAGQGVFPARLCMSRATFARKAPPYGTCQRPERVIQRLSGRQRGLRRLIRVAQDRCIQPGKSGEKEESHRTGGKRNSSR